MDLLRKKLDGFGADEKVRLLFSAHGLPVSVIEKGDPYQWQVEQTSKAIAEALDRDKYARQTRRRHSRPA